VYETGRLKRANQLSILMLAVVATACSTTDSPGSTMGPTSASADAPSSPSLEAATATPEVLEGAFEVADGRELYLVCRGEGSPTVILEAGDESGREEWARVEPEVSAVTRTCAYDRGGIGRSDPISGCRQLPDLTADLAQLLEAAQVPGPYVLVAGSGGGYIAAGFAAEHREDVAGIVFAEVPKAFLNAPPDVVEVTSCDNPDNIEHRDYLQVEADAWNNRAEIGDIPVTIISNAYGPDAEPGEAANVVDQQGWLILSPLATQVIVESGHDVANNEWELVIEEIVKVIEAARSSS
jgi:hypothetical protein